MSTYNSKKTFNKSYNYNSGPFTIILLDRGLAIDKICSILTSLSTEDNVSASDSISLISDIIISDNSYSKDDATVESNILIDETTTGKDDVLPVKSLVSIPEEALGTEAINIAGAYFVIDSNNVLQPLGVLVLKDSRIELIPSTRDITDEIPGMHGGFDFGTEFNARAFDLHVATDEGYAPLEKAHLQRLYAKYLDPTKGPKTLIFSDDIEKTYIVKYSGKIDISQYPSWFEFTLPFKMNNPFITGSFEKMLTGSGTLVNDGTFETSLTIEITGPITNPSLTVGGHLLSYIGTIPSGQTLVINSNGGTGTVKLAGVNAMAGYNGVFPSLPLGSTNVFAGNNIAIKWRNKWL